MAGRLLLPTALLLTLAWLGWSLYEGLSAPSGPGDDAYLAGGRHFADGRYPAALAAYETALAAAPEHLAARRGRAETLIVLGREREAIALYDRLIAAQPGTAGHYANRGIAHDRLGRHEQALADYDAALGLDPAVGEGPGWLTRFLRNQPDKPPGIAERAAYLRAQLALPPDQRLLAVPALDAAQRPHAF